MWLDRNDVLVSQKDFPALGVSKPASMRITVLLPQPDGPRSAKNSLSYIFNEKSEIAVKSPKRFATDRNSASGLALLSSQGANFCPGRGPVTVAFDKDCSPVPAVQHNFLRQ